MAFREQDILLLLRDIADGDLKGRMIGQLVEQGYLRKLEVTSKGWDALHADDPRCHHSWSPGREPEYLCERYKRHGGAHKTPSGCGWNTPGCTYGEFTDEEEEDFYPPK